MKLGPDGTFRLGAPINDGDLGGLNSAFFAVKEFGVCVLKFGALLSWLATPPAAARTLAAQFRKRVHSVFGDLPYDASSLLFEVVANKEKQVVEVYLPSATETIIAKPEVFLALADSLDVAANDLLGAAQS